MSAARNPTARPRRLVLVRGGLDDTRSHEADPDWEDFCHRIGWQTPAPEPDADFERRIAEGLFTRPLALDNVIDLDIERAARHPESLAEARPPSSDLARSSMRRVRRPLAAETAPPSFFDSPGVERHTFEPAAHATARLEVAAQAPFAQEPFAGHLRGGRARAGAVALALAVAAAVVLTITQRVVFSSGSPAASITAPPDTPRGITASPPVDAPLPPEVAPDPSEEPTAKPAPGPKPPRREPRDSRPEPPGTRWARRSPAGARETEETDPRTAAVRDAGDKVSPDGASPPAVGPAPEEAPASAWPIAHAGPAASWVGAARYRVPAHAGPAPSWDSAAGYRAPLSPAIGAASVSVHHRADVLSNASSPAAPAPVEPAAPAGVSWSVSGAKDRWIGASLTPPPAPSFALANVGVMVELDLGKALGAL